MSWNAEAFLRDYRIVSFQQAEGWANISCPFCADSSTHGGFNLVGGYYHCWKCGWHPLERIVRKLTGFRDVDSIVDEYTGRGAMRRVLNRKKAAAMAVTPPGGPLEQRHVDYLKKRDFDPIHLARKYRLTGTGMTGAYKYRIIIPIFHRGQLVSFQGRDVTNKAKLRYKGCPVEDSVINYKHLLYGLDNCSGDSLVVVEGVTDVWRLGDGAAATFGTSFTKSQIKHMSEFKRVFFLFDPEPEAQDSADKAGRQLASLGIKVEILESETDPADLRPHFAESLMKELTGNETSNL